MKKILASIITAFLLAAGLVGTAEVASTAAPGGKKACPYTNCIVTTTTANAPSSIKKNKQATVGVTVKASGNTKPEGTVKVVIKPGNKTVTAKYSGGKVTLTLPKLKPGKYTLAVSYQPKGGTIWKSSSTSKKLTVKK